MSGLWHFYSYSGPKFDAYIGGGCAVDEIVAAATWDEDAWEDLDLVTRIAERIAHTGINYTGLSPEEIKCLDEMLPLLFSPEGLADQLEVTPESPDGLHPSVAQELLLRTSGSALLPILLCGRRFRTSDPSECAYCFLSTAECEQLARTVEQALASGGAWKGKWVPVISQCLVGPLRSAISKGRPLFGALG